MTMLPAAYEQAVSGRSGVLTRFEKCCEHLKEKGQSGVLRSFWAVLARGRAAINMPVPKLVSFLKEGGYLNIYELTARNEKISGEALERAVLAKLQDLGPLRLKLDQLFHFQLDAHYASFNLGGAGARRYGRCCVIFDLEHWSPFYTCYGGDSIRSCCRADKTLALSDEEILEAFALGEDLHRIATIRWRRFLEEQHHCVHPREVRDLIEAEDSLLEIHLHGPVRRPHIREVRFLRADFNHLRHLGEIAKEHSGPLPWEFDNAEPFGQMLELLEQFEIPLILAEE